MSHKTTTKNPYFPLNPGCFMRNPLELFIICVRSDIFVVDKLMMSICIYTQLVILITYHWPSKNSSLKGSHLTKLPTKNPPTSRLHPPLWGTRPHPRICHSSKNRHNWPIQLLPPSNFTFPPSQEISWTHSPGDIYSTQTEKNDRSLWFRNPASYPKASMYGTFIYIYHKSQLILLNIPVPYILWVLVFWDTCGYVPGGRRWKCLRSPLQVILHPEHRDQFKSEMFIPSAPNIPCFPFGVIGLQKPTTQKGGRGCSIRAKPLPSNNFQGEILAFRVD